MRKQTDYQKQKAREAQTTHGMSKHRIYRVWSEIKQRCSNKNSTYYFNYGGRGIKYCPTWEKFESFYKDMGIPPDGGMIDRIDNNGNYCKENCKWSTRSEQMNNTRKTRFLTIKGVRKTVTEFSKQYNINSKTINRRIREGWSDEDSVKPLQKSKNL